MKFARLSTTTVAHATVASHASPQANFPHRRTRTAVRRPITWSSAEYETRPHQYAKAESLSSTSRSSVATTHDDEARMRLTKCEDQNKVLTNKIGAVEKEVTGLRGSFADTLQTKLDLTSKTMMSEFKDMMLTFSVAAQPAVQPGRTKDRERAGRSRSPKED